jgi:hypothetical protein
MFSTENQNLAQIIALYFFQPEAACVPIFEQSRDHRIILGHCPRMVALSLQVVAILRKQPQRKKA